MFVVGGAAENDQDFQYIWYFVVYRAAADGDEVLAEGQGWIAGATYSPGAHDSEWFIEWDEHTCPPEPVGRQTLDRLTDWARAACVLNE